MFSKILRHPLHQTITSILSGALLALVSLHANAVNELVDDVAVPVGSHTDLHAQFSNARHLWQSGKLKQAAALYEALIKRYPDLPDPYNNLAVIYAAQGDYKKAQQILEKGLNTHAGYAAIYENLTAIYVEMARDSYGKALQLDDKSQRQLKLRALAELSVKPLQVAKAESPLVASSDKPKTQPAATASVDTDKQKTADDKPAVVATSSSVKPVQDAAVKPAPQRPAVDPNAIVQTLESWAAAWSAQSAEQYLNYYEQDFHPPGVSRRRWQAQRIDRIKRPQWIRVSLSDFSVQAVTDKRVRVEVQQRYQSNTYSDNGRKEFILIQTEQGWRIVSERNL